MRWRKRDDNKIQENDPPPSPSTRQALPSRRQQFETHTVDGRPRGYKGRGENGSYGSSYLKRAVTR